MYINLACLLVNLFFFLPCCGQSIKKTIGLKEYKYYKNDKRIVYGLDVAIPGSYEAYVNDVLVEQSNDPGMHNTFININQAILKSGTYNFRIKVYPTSGEKTGIDAETLFFMKVGLATYEKMQVGDEFIPGTYKYLENFPVSKIEKGVPFYEMTGKFTIEVPYEIEGWNTGQDLRKLDQKKLESKVVSFYQKIWNILNDGDGSKWEELTARRRQELLIFNYYLKEELLTEINKEKNEISDRKGRMAPLEDYKMQIYANGKLVTLERVNHTKQMNKKEIDAKGRSPLIRNGKIKGVSFYPIKLYLPSDSTEFVIIRK